MKKALPVFLLIAVAVAAYLYLIQKGPSGSSKVPALLPEETLALLYFPDLPRTKEAWKKTSLYRISQEPEVAKFMTPLLEGSSGYAATQSNLERIAQCGLVEGFVAVKDAKPTLVAGFQFSGKREDVEVLVAEAKAALQDAYPTGQLDIQLHGVVEIETFRNDSSEFAVAFVEKWLIAANDVEILMATIDRIRTGDEAGSLEKNTLFKSAMKKMPEGFDGLLFAQTEVLIERFLTLLSVSGQRLDEKQVTELRKVKAIAASAKFEGENVRDTMFALKPGSAAKPELTRSSLAFTGEDTVLYYDSKFEVPEELNLPDASLDVTGILAMVKGFQAALESQGVTMVAVGEAFGPESSLLLTWEKESMQPTFLMVLDVRDYAKAVSLLDAVAVAGLGGIPVVRKELEGGVYYAMQSTGLPWLPPPGLALSKKHAVIGLSIEGIMAGLTHAATGKGGLADSPAYKTSAEAVAHPTGSFGYVDTQALFDRVYGAARAFLITYSMFAPETSSIPDPATLPPGEAISKHLGPMVFSQAEVQNGVLAESVGPMTFSQSIFAAVVGGGAAVFPLIKKQLDEGGLFPGPGGLSGMLSSPSPTPVSAAISGAAGIPPETPIGTASSPSSHAPETGETEVEETGGEAMKPAP